MNEQSTQILNELLSNLDQAAIRKAGQGDAIERELAGSPRRSAVVGLRDSAVAQAFRDELTNGLIRVDTVNRLLRLVNEVVTRLVP